MKGIYWFLLLILVVAGGYWYLIRQSAVSSPAVPLPMVTTTPTFSPSAVPTTPAAKVETALLKAVGKYQGSGTATRQFDGTTFRHEISANLVDPAQGKFYEGWLVKKTPSLTFFSTGKLAKSGSVYGLIYTATKDYRDYRFIVVTEETAALGLDGKPEAHVLEGSF